MDPYRMSNKSRAAKQESLRRIVQIRRTRGTESDWSVLLGEAARSLGPLPVPPPLPEISDPELFLDFFGSTLDCGVFPRKSRRPLTIDSKSRA